MVVRDCFEAMDADAATVRLSGGGTTSSALCQLLADVIGRPVQRAEASELTCRGAALYASLILGDPTALARWRPTVEQRWTPDPQRASFYAERFADFRRVRALAAQGWRARDAESAVQ